MSVIYFNHILFLHGQLVDHVNATQLFQVSTVTIQLLSHFFLGRRLKSSTDLFYVPKSDISFDFKQNVIGKSCKEFEYGLHVLQIETSWMKRNITTDIAKEINL